MKGYWLALISILYHLNMMFDRIDERRRLLVFLGVAMPGMVLTASVSISPLFSIIGILYLLFLIFVRAAFLTDKLNRGKL